jgi:hypothetical protein
MGGEFQRHQQPRGGVRKVRLGRRQQCVQPINRFNPDSPL